jgi:hypothetical protein
MSDGGWVLAAMLAEDEEWKCLTNPKFTLRKQNQAWVHVARSLFRKIDRLILKHSKITQAVLNSRTGDSSTRLNGELNSTAAETVVLNRRAAARVLACLCHGRGVRYETDKVLFEESIKRLVRLSGDNEYPYHLESSALCFAQLSILKLDVDVNRFLDICLDTLTPDIFRDILLPCPEVDASGFRATTCIDSIPLPIRERRYRWLCIIIQRFMIRGQARKRTLLSSSVGELEKFVADHCLPYVMSKMIVDMDYDALRLTTGFRLFIRWLQMQENKSCNKARLQSTLGEPAGDLVVGKTSTGSLRGVKSWAKKLEHSCRELCLSPNFVECILPTIFIKAGHEQLSFFKTTVLQDTMALNTMIQSRDQCILKGLVWELSRNPDFAEHAMKAVRTCAIYRAHDILNEDGSKEYTGTKEAVEWLSTNFLYLLVNVIQFQWKIRSAIQRTRAMRCLVMMLGFLPASESPQYFPQILATVNVAISSEIDDSDQAMPTELVIYAVYALSQFVKLVAQEQVETIGDNLTSVVVSLIPVLPNDQGQCDSIERSVYGKDACRIAVALLEWLSQGELGKKLAPFFSEIPFLPSSSALDAVRSNLRILDVDFESLNLTTVQPALTASPTSDASARTQSLVDMSKKQAALQRRLETICSLLSNESANIRRVSIQHLTNLLRSNRDIFHMLVENEEFSSMKRYLTVAYTGKGKLG